MPPYTTIAVVLAAGGSTRMGRPKALLPVGGQTLLRRHVQGLRAVGLRVRVATGGHGAAVAAEAARAGASAHPNPDWARTGPIASLRGCLAGLSDDTRLLVTPVDVPPAPPRVLSALLGAPGPAVASVDGADAHPVCVTAGAVRRLSPDQTLRDALRAAPRVPVDFPDGLRNLNTPAAFRSWCAGVDVPR